MSSGNGSGGLHGQSSQAGGQNAPEAQKPPEIPVHRVTAVDIISRPTSRPIMSAVQVGINMLITADVKS